MREAYFHFPVFATRAPFCRRAPLRGDIVMLQPLPAPIAAYFAAKNAHDIAAMLAPFADTASVKDEGEEKHGRAAIRDWMEETTRKYRVTVDVTDIAGDADRPVVTGKVSGTFPGSPVSLRYAFVLNGEKIARLEIGA
jgi:ketosteroid isomerase-like protein